ncbi:MAG: ABC transporter permease subunit [Bdellovibrionota bacterium]
MLKYLLRRLILILPTLFGITVVVFIIINLAPGGPIEQKIQQIRFAGGNSTSEKNAVSEEVIEALKVQYGFDKPLVTRYFIWLKNIATLDFGESFSYEEPVTELIVSKFPVSIQFGVLSFILAYLISIPLGIIKAVKNGTEFDWFTSFILLILYSVPPFMLGILMIVYLAGGSFLDIFPIGGLFSDGYAEMSFGAKIWDRIHHFILPLACYVIGSFTTLTLLMKNSLLEEISKDYIRTARSKGLDEKAVVMKHALRNAMIPIATGFGGFIGVFFAGSLLIEKIFQLDGIGLLSFNSTMARDYNVIMGLVFIQSVLFLVGNIISDIMYVLIDPRIDFN